MEAEIITGLVIDVRGPFYDGSYELDVETPAGEEVTVAVSAEQYAELIADRVPVEELS